MFIPSLFLGVIFVLLAYQLVTGKVFDRSFRVWARREHQPLRYWLAIAIEFFVIAICVGALIHEFLQQKG